MQVGSNLPIEPEIIQLGFDIRDEFTLLGLIIQKDSGLWEKNFEKMSSAIRKEINFWLRFNLSLPGRIAVAKSMFYSQLNYLGSFLPLNENFVLDWSNLIENFVRYGSWPSNHLKKSSVPMQNRRRVGSFLH